MLIGSEALANSLLAGHSHLFRSIRLLVQTGDSVAEGVDVTDSIQQTGLSFLDEFAARSKIRRDDRARVRVGFDDAFTEGFEGVRGEDGEAGI